MTDGTEKTTYSVEVTEWAHPAGRGPVETSLVRMSTPDPVIAAATLRAVADRLDPPRPSGTYAHDVDCNTIHEAGPEACPPPRTPAEKAAARVARPAVEALPPSELPDPRPGEVEIRTGTGTYILGRVVRVRRRQRGTTPWPISIVAYRAEKGLYLPGGVLRLSTAEAETLRDAIDAMIGEVRAAGVEGPIAALPALRKAPGATPTAP